LLALADEELIAGVAGRQAARVADEHAQFDPAAARVRCAERGVEPICRCDARYPRVLHELPDAPAVLHVFGQHDRLGALLDGAGVAIVGARRATPYGVEQARRLGRGLAAAGVTVVSGMALGVDAAAHAGALDAGGPTVAVLAGAAERAYPASKRWLHERIAASGVVVSELPPGTTARRWGFPARNRIIAALARVTVVVEAGERSGSLITAGLALELGREVGAVPGPVTAPLSAGTNALLADGARLVRGPQDVLELMFGADAREVDVAAAPALPPDLQALLDRVGGGEDTVAALAHDGLGVDAVLAGLAQLELRGLVRRAAGGRYVRLS
jgi:DNA processing protein